MSELDRQSLEQRIEALEHENVALRTTLRTVPGLMFDLDEHGRYHRLWAWAPELLAAPEQSFIGRTVGQVLPADAAAEVMQTIEEALRTGAATGRIIRLVVPAGERFFELSAASLPPRPDGSRHVIVFSTDVTQARVLQRRLAEAQRLASLAAWELDLLTQREWWSDEAYRMNGVAPGTPIEHGLFLGLIHPEDRQAFSAAFAVAMAEGQCSHDFRIIQPDGAVRHLHGTASVTRDASGRPIRLVGTNLDVTEHKRIEETLRVSETQLRHREEQLRLAVEAAGQGKWELDVESGHFHYSAEYARMLGFTDGELVEEDLADFESRIHPADRERTLGDFKAQLRGESPKCTAEFRLRTRAGTWKWILCAGRVIERAPDGRPLRMIGLHQDIDDRKRTELAIVEALHDKETLLRELHHRVKNNLQIVSSLLHFQGKKVVDPAAQAVFGEARDRLRAMILVHEQLYRSGDLARVDFARFVEALVADGARSSHGSAIRLSAHIGVTPCFLPVATALPLGMLLNELVTNALKHGFPGDAGGAVQVTITQEENTLVLCVHDEGVGMRKDALSGEAATFGLLLVQSLAQQLGASLALCPGPGTGITVRAPLGHPSQGGAP